MNSFDSCVMYFSLDDSVVWWFNTYVIRKEFEFLCSFTLLNKECSSFRHTVDLREWLKQYEGDYSRLHVIIDYVSLKNSPEENPSRVMRDIILQYPEVQFLFDESYVIKYIAGHGGKHRLDFRDFLFPRDSSSGNKIDYASMVFMELHIFDINSEKAFDSIIRGRNNTFDASNLRYALKRWQFEELDVHDNFQVLRDSRYDHLALIVEEERTQNIYNSFAMFANGYRVLPISSAAELKWINSEKSAKSLLEPNVILRDYDLQFPDKPSGEEEIYLIRCWYHPNKSNSLWIKQYPKVNIPTANEQKVSDKNPYWSNLERIKWDKKEGVKIVYLTKGEPGMKLSDSLQSEEGDETSSIKIRGLSKPVSGIYEFHRIRFIREVFEKIKNDDNNKIETHRRGLTGGHSIPLNIYDAAREMIKRAEWYFRKHKYVHSAILANETLEYLNGFHQSLMIRAYRCYVNAENAVALSSLGGDEMLLARDVASRLRMVKHTIVRILSSSEESDEPQHTPENISQLDKHMVRRIEKKGRNIINQIFNDIRIFCNENEHFEAEDVVISAIAHENERLFGRLWI